MITMLKKIFKTKNPIIGMIHLQSLIGYPNHRGLDYVIKRALADKTNLEEGGVDGILVENTYDHPHKILVGPETTASMTHVINEIIRKTSLPVGVIALWNDYRAAFSIAKTTGAKFVRVPVFVDHIRTDFGDIKGEPEKVINFRKQIEAENIGLFTDIHVKHSKLLEKTPIEISIKKAIERGADAIIITGKETGDPPTIEKLRKARASAKKFPILVGSGSNNKNIGEILKYADGVIVGTSLETRGHVDVKKVRQFVKVFHKFV
jgi:hypothetical protein